jgi:hypothetical protein
LYGKERKINKIEKSGIRPPNLLIFLSFRAVLWVLYLFLCYINELYIIFADKTACHSKAKIT